jgi:predicted nucleic acid-binding protein
VRIAVDTNVLAYAEGVNGPERQAEAVQVLYSLRAHQRVIPIQVFGELFSVLRRKTARTGDVIRQNVLAWQDIATCVPTTWNVLLRAGDLATDHRLNIWDAVIFAAAAEAGCNALLSEDMQDGFLWGGVRIINPFQPAGWMQLQTLVGA